MTSSVGMHACRASVEVGARKSLLCESASRSVTPPSGVRHAAAATQCVSTPRTKPHAAHAAASPAGAASSARSAASPAPLTPENWAGVALACVGALLYGVL